MIDDLRAASRRLVRELGFMGGDFAGTKLSPSAVHALIEIEREGVAARDLASLLRLEKSSVSRMLRKLVQAGYVAEAIADEDGRAKRLSLTAKGMEQLAEIHAFAREQVSSALSRLEPGQDRVVLDGLSLYAAALAHQGGNLITKRLASAGWHKNQGVPAMHQVFNNGMLIAAERVVAKNLLQDVKRGSRG